MSTTSPKWLVTADIHVHQHKKSSERLQDCLDALDWIFQTAVDKSASNIIIAGDLFFDRFKIDVPTYQRTFEIFKKYTDANDFHVWLLIGNHDMYMHNTWNISSMVPFSGIPTITVINKPQVVLIDNIPTAFLPYTADPIADLKYLETNCDPANVLFGHIALDNAVLNPLYNTKSEIQLENDGDMVKVDSGLFKNWSQVFLGHYHAAQNIGSNVEYVGSPLQLTFGEAFQTKHVIIYHPESGMKEYVENDFSPSHYILKKDEIKKYNLAGNFVKLMTNDLDSLGLLNVRREFIEDIGAKSFEIQNTKSGEVAMNEDVVVVENALSILDDEYAIFEKFVEETEKKIGLNGLDQKRLLETCQKVIEEARKIQEGKDETHEEA